MRFSVMAALIFTLIACSATPSAPTKPPAATSVAATATGSPTTTVPTTATNARTTAVPTSAIVQGGFGDTLDGFVKKYGEPTYRSSAVPAFENGRYGVVLANGRVVNLSVSFEHLPGRSVPFGDAQEAVKSLLPRDASYSRTFACGRDCLVEVYDSPTLGQLFEEQFFKAHEGGYAAGRFTAIYEHYPDNQVFSVVLGLGDANP